MVDLSGYFAHTEPMPMTGVSLFAGVGGFDLAMERHGIKVVAHCEIDKHAKKVLAERFPHAQQFSDVKELSGHDLISAGFVPDRGVITGGFPCQDLSVAGRRLGFTGARSSLFYEIARLADETQARWLVLENVPGLLTSQRGADMGAVIGTLVDGGYCVSWRVLDAQHFGVPQRRRRVFIVAERTGDPTRCAQVLFESEGVRGDTSSSRTTGEETARGVGKGADGAIAFSHTNGLDLQPGDVVPTLRVGSAGGAVMEPLAFDEMNFTTTEKHQTLRAGTPQSTGVVEPEVFGQTGFARYSEGEVTTLRESQHKRPEQNVVVDPIASSGLQYGIRLGSVVRRLTPLECERLQGFPDGWTEGQADSHRYKQMGNAVAVPVVEWIIGRLVKQ